MKTILITITLLLTIGCQSPVTTYQIENGTDSTLIGVSGFYFDGVQILDNHNFGNLESGVTTAKTVTTRPTVGVSFYIGPNVCIAVPDFSITKDQNNTLTLYGTTIVNCG